MSETMRESERVNATQRIDNNYHNNIDKYDKYDDKVDDKIGDKMGDKVGINDDVEEEKVMQFLYGNLSDESFLFSQHYPVTWSLHLFVSSTCSDVNIEKRVLRDEIIPQLNRSIGLPNGIAISMVDVHCGRISDASDVLEYSCWSDEFVILKDCQEKSKGMFFITLLASRYGPCLPPKYVPQASFETRHKQLLTSHPQICQLLDDWYELNDNLLSPQYVLRIAKRATITNWHSFISPALCKALENISLEIVSLHHNSLRNEVVEKDVCADLVVNRSVLEWTARCAIANNKSEEESKEASDLIVDFNEDNEHVNRLFWIQRVFTEGFQLVDPFKKLCDVGEDMSTQLKWTTLTAWMESSLNYRSSGNANERINESRSDIERQSPIPKQTRSANFVNISISCHDYDKAGDIRWKQYLADWQSKVQSRLLDEINRISVHKRAIERSVWDRFGMKLFDFSIIFHHCRLAGRAERHFVGFSQLLSSTISSIYGTGEITSSTAMLLSPSSFSSSSSLAILSPIRTSSLPQMSAYSSPPRSGLKSSIGRENQNATVSGLESSVRSALQTVPAGLHSDSFLHLVGSLPSQVSVTSTTSNANESGSSCTLHQNIIFVKGGSGFGKTRFMARLASLLSSLELAREAKQPLSPGKYSKFTRRPVLIRFCSASSLFGCRSAHGLLISLCRQLQLLCDVEPTSGSGLNLEFDFEAAIESFQFYVREFPMLVLIDDLDSIATDPTTMDFLPRLQLHKNTRIIISCTIPMHYYDWHQTAVATEQISQSLLATGEESEEEEEVQPMPIDVDTAFDLCLHNVDFRSTSVAEVTNSSDDVINISEDDLLDEIQPLADDIQQGSTNDQNLPIENVQNSLTAQDQSTPAVIAAGFRKKSLEIPMFDRWRANSFIVEPISVEVAQKMLNLGLLREDRKLSLEQLQCVYKLFTVVDNRIPLFIQLLVFISRNWSSQLSPEQLNIPRTMSAMAMEIVSGMNSTFGDHFCMRICFILYHAISGVSDCEMVDLLSCDAICVTNVQKRWDLDCNFVPLSVWLRWRVAYGSFLRESESGRVCWASKALAKHFYNDYVAKFGDNFVSSTRAIMGQYYCNLLTPNMTCRGPMQPQTIVFPESYSIWTICTPVTPSEPVEGGLDPSINMARCFDGVVHLLATDMIPEAVGELTNWNVICAYLLLGRSHELLSFLGSCIVKYRQAQRSATTESSTNTKPAHVLSQDVSSSNYSSSVFLNRVGPLEKIEEMFEWLQREKEHVQRSPQTNIVASVRSSLDSTSTLRQDLERLLESITRPSLDVKLTESEASTKDTRGQVNLKESVRTSRVDNSGKYTEASAAGALTDATKGMPQSALYECPNQQMINQADQAWSWRTWFVPNLYGDCRKMVGSPITNLQGHSARVTAVLVDNSRHRVLSSSFDGSICIWHMFTHQLLCTLRGHQREVTSMTFVGFHPDLLFSSSVDGTVRLWNIRQGFELGVVVSNHGMKPIRGSCAIPSGNRLATWVGDKSIRIYDLSQFWDQYELPTVADGIKCAPSGSESMTIREPLLTLSGHTGNVVAAVFGTSGMFLASSAQDKSIRVWEPFAGKLLFVLVGHTGTASNIIASPVAISSKVLSCSDDKTIRLWDCERGALVRTFSGHTKSVTSIDFAIDESTFCSGSLDGTIKTWDCASGVIISSFTCGGNVSIVRSGMVGYRLFSVQDSKFIRVWSAYTDSPSPVTAAQFPTATSSSSVVMSTGHKDKVVALDFVGLTSSQALVASVALDGVILVWNPDIVSDDNLTPSNCFRSVAGFVSAVGMIAVAGGLHLIHISESMEYRKWDCKTSKLLVESTLIVPSTSLLETATSGSRSGTSSKGTNPKTADNLTSRFLNRCDIIAISADGRIAATVAFPGSNTKESYVLLWDLMSVSSGPKFLHQVVIPLFPNRVYDGRSSNATNVRDRNPSVDRVSAIRFNSDRSSLAVAVGSCVVVWCLSNLLSTEPVLLCALFGHETDITTIDFHCAGVLIVSGSKDCTIRTWSTRVLSDLNDEADQATLAINGETFVRASPTTVITDRTVASAIDYNSIPRGRLVFTGSHHTNEVLGVCFNCDGYRIASYAANESSILIWHAFDGTIMAQIPLMARNQISCLRFVQSPSWGSGLIMGGDDGSVTMWTGYGSSSKSN